MFHEFDIVKATKDLPNPSDIGSARIVPGGQTGTIMIAYSPSREHPKGAYEVEFCNDLDTLAVMLVDGRDLELVCSYAETKSKETPSQQQRQAKPKTA